MAVFFYNLYICAHQHGDITTGTLGIEPPSVAQYLHSANTHNLIHLLPDKAGDGKMVDMGGQYQYYHAH